MKCIAYTKIGRRCKKHSSVDSEFCCVHCKVPEKKYNILTYFNFLLHVFLLVYFITYI